MKKTALTLSIIFILVTSLPVFANSSLLHEALLQSPGSSESDWSAISLLVAGESFDKEGYMAELSRYVSDKYQKSGTLSANKSTEYHRIALLINLLGYDATNFAGVNLINDGIYYREGLGRQGLNGYIWALITLSSGNFYEPVDAINTKSSLISTILSRQNADGGFALSGNMSSCDMTSMAVYALSFYKDRADVKASIDKAVNYLMANKNQDGSFSENGLPNAESTAQVIIALSSLGQETDRSILNALMNFKSGDGFSHTIGGVQDIIATYQATCAVAAYNKQSAVYLNYLTNSAKNTETVEYDVILHEKPDFTSEEEEKIATDVTQEIPKVKEVVNFYEPTEVETITPKAPTDCPTEADTVVCDAIVPTEKETEKESAASNQENSDFNNVVLIAIVLFSFIIVSVVIIVRRYR
ncbi:MAG: prenyltransferase/squalene oxidase repeat-containing protein [Clostridia bacterium]